MSKRSIARLRTELNEQHNLKLLRSDEVKRPSGVSTGWNALDAFSISGGFPCGEIGFLISPPGLGGSTLWLQAAARVTSQGRRCAWINGDYLLNPVTAAQLGVDLSHLMFVEKPESAKQRLWVLQELLSSRLFDLVGCDLGDARLPLRESRALLMQARRSGTAVVFVARESQNSPAASLVLHYQSDRVLISRAAHRPVPHSLQRSQRHVEFISGPLDPSSLFALPRHLSSERGSIDPQSLRGG